MTEVEREIRERLTKAEEHVKTNTQQILELKPIVNEIHTMSQTMVKLIEQVKATNNNVEELKNKVESIEKEPSRRMDQIKAAIIAAFVTAIISGAASAVFMFGK